MRIEKINNYKTYHANYPNAATKRNFQNNPAVLINSMDALAALNKPNFTGKKYELGLSHDELVKRTSNEYFYKIKLLSPESPQYENLADGDKKALVHLAKAAHLIGEINLKLDDENNIPFRKYLEKEIAKGNEDAVLTKKLFDGQKGIFAHDNHFHHYSLAKGLTQSPGRGVYPRDLSVDEFHQILKEMLENGKDKDVAKILTQRSVVERNGKYLKGIDYVDKFKKEFAIVADELEKAAQVSTNEYFNGYLRLQAKALRNADPMLDAKADIRWATLQDTPLEFTITRENYNDQMTQTIFDNNELLSLLKEHCITPVSKDFIGGRVGIIDKEGTEFLKKSKDILPYLAKLMPYRDEYTQVISKDTKQTMVDADLINLTGDVGTYRGQITAAENLPNNDKLSIKLGGGRRNVYHRQMRNTSSSNMTKKLSVLDAMQRQYVTNSSSHFFTVGHENAHSLGPKNIKNLGKYRNIIEENKADIAAISFVDDLTDIGIYTEDERKGILINFVLQNFLQAKPDMASAHRVRQVMQCKYFGDNGVYDFTLDGKIHVNVERVVPTAKKMLNEIIRIQADDDYEAAENYVNRNFVWTPDMEYMAEKLQKCSKILNGTLETPLDDYLIKQ